MIHKALIEITKGIGAVEKGRTNTTQGFKFRGIDDVMNALHTLFADNGIYIRVAEIKTVLREDKAAKSGGVNIYSVNDYRFVFTAEDGSNIEAWARGEAFDSGDKSSNKAVSIALKYCLIQMFLIPTLDDKDPDNTTPPPIALPTPPPTVKAPKSQPDELTEERAIGMIRNAQTKDELASVWKAIGPNIQRAAIVIQEKDARKAQLTETV